MNNKFLSSCFTISVIAAAQFMTSCSKDSNDNPNDPNGGKPTIEEPTFENHPLGAKINTQEAQKGYMVLVTKKDPSSEQIELYLGADKNDQDGVWIDLNNDGIRQDNKKISYFGNSYEKYTFSKNVITIYGKVTILGCLDNKITNLNISKNPALNKVTCFSNQKKKDEMDALLRNLPKKETSQARITMHRIQNDGNSEPTSEQIHKAKEKGWEVCIYDSEYMREHPAGIERMLVITERDDNKITFTIDAEEKDRAGVWIDLNHDAVCQEGENVSVFQNHNIYTTHFQNPAKKHIWIYGNVTQFHCISNKINTLDVRNNHHLEVLKCYNNKITQLDVSENTNLKTLHCYRNSIQHTNMLALLNGLPKRTNNDGEIFIYSDVIGQEGNHKASASDVKTAKDKGWRAYYLLGNGNKMEI